MKRVLITGGAGFLGRQVIEPLASRGFEVFAFVHSRIPESSGVAGVEIGDLFHSPSIERALLKIRPTHLLHLAWFAEPGKFWESPENTRWFDISLKMVDAAVKVGVSRIVGAGSCAEYGFHDSYCDEGNTETSPDTSYGRCKNDFRMASEALCRASGVSFGWGRVFHLYGPGERTERFIPTVIRAAMLGRSIRCEDGESIRDFIEVSDAGRAFAALLDCNVQGAVNIASGESASFKDVAQKILALFPGSACQVTFGNDSPPRNFLASNRRLREEIDWMGRYNLNGGLARAVEWWKRHVPIGFEPCTRKGENS